MKKFIICIFTICFLFSSSLAAEGTNRTVKVNKVIDDEISENGETDCFNFSISDPGSLMIRFDFDVEGTYNVNMINIETGKTIQTNSFKSDVNTSSGRYEKYGNKIRVDEGEYQIKVSRGYFSSCDEEYELEIVYDEESGDEYEKESNNEAKTAMLIDYNGKVTGNLESDNDVDWYMTEIPSFGELYTELKFDNEAVYNVEIFSENSGSLKSLGSKKYEAKLATNYDTYSDSSEIIRVPEGNYYFKISRTWSNYSNEDYTLYVRYAGNKRGNYEQEFNNEPKNATEAVTNCEFVGNLSNSGDVDYYRIGIWDSNKLTVKMNIPDGAAYNVTTYKEVNGELSSLKTERLSNKELPGAVLGEEQEIAYGNYYFKITSRTYSNKDYTFEVVTNNSYNPNKRMIILQINNPYIRVNDISYPIDGNRGTAPVILNGRTMLPARALIEALGGTVTWIESAKGININLDGKNVYLTLDSALAYVNGQELWLDVAPTSINGRTMVPVRFVMDNLGGNTVWNGNDGTVTITY